jgi:penicillin-binding protein 1A
VTVALLASCVFLLGMLVYWVVVVSELPSTADLRRSRFEQATVVYSADGIELTSYQDKNRTWVALDEISPWVTKALIAAEDHRFYEHNGIDVIRTIGSLFRSLGGDWQGGSTITMQFARNAFPDIYDDMVITRKIKEWITSVKIESMYEKDEILEMYLNTVPFMYNAFGIEAASHTYFQAPASALNAKGAATLVGMLKGTVFYNPVRHPERSHERRNVVLQQMVKHGALDAADYEQVKDVPSRITFKKLSRAEEPAPHFAEFLRGWIDEWAERYGMNPYTDGLRVHTTIDARLQQAAQAAINAVGNQLQAAADREIRFASVWERNPGLIDQSIRQTYRYRALVESGVSADAALDTLHAMPEFADSVKSKLRLVQAGFVAVNPHNGFVQAWVGGRDFSEVQFDHVAMSKRQPGSTFKPFVYTAAVANGYSPTHMVRDEEVSYVDPDTRRRWTPTNVGTSSGQMVTLRDALAYSKNTITAQLTMQIGPGIVAEYAHRMGIKSELDEVPSIGLGTSEVSLLELTAALGTLANYGQHNEPVFVTRIEDNEGIVIATFGGSSRSAIPASTAYTVLDMMRAVVQYGTGQRIRGQYGVRDDVAGKTGTSQNGADGWFVLLHPNLAMGAWVGFASPAIHFRSEYWGQGAHTALPIVGRFYRGAKRAAPEVLSSEAKFLPPAGWVEPQAPDTMWRYDYYRFASYEDSLSAARDSSFRAMSDSSWRYIYDAIEDEDGEEEDLEEVEGVEKADSLNRQELRRSRGGDRDSRRRERGGDEDEDQRSARRGDSGDRKESEEKDEEKEKKEDGAGEKEKDDGKRDDE